MPSGKIQNSKFNTFGSLRPDTLQIVAVGDIMMGTMYPTPEHLPKEGCERSFSMVKDYFAGADVLFGNLEGALIETTYGAKKCKNPEWCYTFGMPLPFVDCLSEAGFTVMSLANNHSGDFGIQGRNTTRQALESSGIRYAGLTDCPSTEWTRDSIRYGFCAFAPNDGTMNVNDTAAARALVQQLSRRCDIVIVSFHAGAEGRTYQHVTRKEETFVGENRGNVYDFAHRMIDAGADVLLGHGPHVTRAVEVYKDRFIAYSLGNFSTYSRINVAGVNGLAPIIRVYTDTQGRCLKAHITPTWQPVDDRTPRYDPEKRVIERIRTLTAEDFPEGTITISPDGWIIPTSQQP